MRTLLEKEAKIPMPFATCKLRMGNVISKREMTEQRHLTRASLQCFNMSLILRYIQKKSEILILMLF